MVGAVNNMETIINMIEKIVIIALPIFAISMFIIIRTARQHNADLVESAITSHLLLNFDLAVFRNSRREYFKVKRSKVLLRINFITFLITAIGFIFIFSFSIFDMINNF